MQAGEFCVSTLDALHRFQHARGLREADVCDLDCWNALVEATWRLGDRLLLLTSPNLRGDDVGELQSRLTRLGFDCGRVDGIFGPRTAGALTSFQSDCGLHADGVCGTDSIRMLDRVIGQTGSGPGVGAVREREQLRGEAPTDISSLRLAIGQFSGLSTISRLVSRELRHHGAQVMPLDEPDPVAQAQAANRFGAHAYIGLETTLEQRSHVTFYRVPTFESVGGHSLADCLTAELRRTPLIVDESQGLRLPVLRETRMPAVLASLGPVRAVLDATPSVADAIGRAVQSWLQVWTLTP
jgi:N-acetylmuramoyl-L-alanine amidase